MTACSNRLFIYITNENYSVENIVSNENGDILDNFSLEETGEKITKIAKNQIETSLGKKTYLRKYEMPEWKYRNTIEKRREQIRKYHEMHNEISSRASRRISECYSEKGVLVNKRRRYEIIKRRERKINGLESMVTPIEDLIRLALKSK